MSGPLERTLIVKNLPDLTDLTKDQIMKLLSELSDVPGDTRLDCIAEDEYGRDRSISGDFRFSYYAPETPEAYAERIKAEKEAAEALRRRALSDAIRQKKVFEDAVVNWQKRIDQLSTK